MTPITSKKAQKAPWPESIDLSNQLFVEADQLSEAAYAILSKQPISAQTLHEFSELKRRADEKYLEARQQWLETKGKITR
ncbi:hypothetical protein ACN1C3_26095 [Pseudomonas sp. H11T01]|uniref:hypothetical protein n=1 Tax=Pseudomonas sp. H11T01 TaxID=3402749 RepID=UPI003ACE388D